jgi:translation initiation factor 4E
VRSAAFQPLECSSVPLESNATCADAERSHYIHVKRPSQLNRDVNLYLFRDLPNCSPMWEAFPQGGCWILKIKKKANVLGKMWQDLVFAAVGEAFENTDVVGIAMAIRSKEDMISVWNADNSDDNTRFAIGCVRPLVVVLVA